MASINAKSSAEDCVAWLLQLPGNFDSYETAMRSGNVDGMRLLGINHDELFSLLGVKSLGHKHLIKKHLKLLRQANSDVSVVAAGDRSSHPSSMTVSEPAQASDAATRTSPSRTAVKEKTATPSQAEFTKAAPSVSPSKHVTAEDAAIPFEAETPSSPEQTIPRVDSSVPTKDPAVALSQCHLKKPQEHNASDEKTTPLKEGQPSPFSQENKIVPTRSLSRRHASSSVASTKQGRHASMSVASTKQGQHAASSSVANNKQGRHASLSVASTNQVSFTLFLLFSLRRC